MLNGWMNVNEELTIMVWRWPWPILRYRSSVWWEGLKKK